MEQAQFIGQIINDVILLATLAVIIWYTVKTADMAAATRQSAESARRTLDEMHEARDRESAPYVICYFDAMAHDQLIYFVVKNEGKSVAHNVRLEIAPPLTTSHGPLKDMVLLSEGVASLAPGQEIRTFFDSTIGIFSHDDLPLQYKARVTYSGGMNERERVADQTLDLAAYRGLLFTPRNGMHELVKAVEGVKDYVGKANGQLEDISDRLDKGVWLQNPSLMPSITTADAEVACSQLVAKLREVQLVWESSPRDRENDIIPFHLDLQPRATALSHQVLTLLAASKDSLSSESTAAVARIAASLLELGTMKFYIDGGQSIRRFNEAGAAIAASIHDAVEMLQANVAPAKSGAAVQSLPEAEPEATVVPAASDDNHGQPDSASQDD